MGEGITTLGIGRRTPLFPKVDLTTPQLWTLPTNGNTVVGELSADMCDCFFPSPFPLNTQSYHIAPPPPTGDVTTSMTRIEGARFPRILRDVTADERRHGVSRRPTCLTYTTSWIEYPVIRSKATQHTCFP